MHVPASRDVLVNEGSEATDELLARRILDGDAVVQALIGTFLVTMTSVHGNIPDLPKPHFTIVIQNALSAHLRCSKQKSLRSGGSGGIRKTDVPVLFKRNRSL